MPLDTAITVEGVSKKFTTNLRRSMRYGTQDIARNLLGLSTRSDRLRTSEFWAVDDISFEVKPGDALGIVGPNGAGKSTLLRMLNGIVRPDKGTIRIRGRVGALIEMGAGFHPMLTGRENIYVNGTVLGMGRAEINRKFDSIVSFADIGRFLDMPVKYYSSGMYVRLGFAIAAHCEPEVLLVDEVLSVGDIGFQRKCFRYFEEEVLKKGVTLILVSHNVYAIARMCQRGILLDRGRLVHDGNTNDLSVKYFQVVNKRELSNDAHNSLAAALRSGAGELRLSQLTFQTGDGNDAGRLRPGASLEVILNLEAQREFSYVPSVVLKILDQANTVLAVSQLGPEIRRNIKFLPGSNCISCRFHSLNLLPGRYTLQVKIGGGTDLLQDNVPDAGHIEIVGDDDVYAATEGAGLLYLPSVWTVVR